MILSHSSYREAEELNLWITQQRADSIKFQLEKRVDSTLKIKAKGMGAHYPTLHRDSLGKISRLTRFFIASLRDNAEKEKIHRLNKRIEIVVLKSNSTQLYKRINSDIRFTHPEDGGIFKIPEIRYDFRKWHLQKNDSVNSVDSLKILADFMRKYPNLVVKIMVHTDCRGSKYSSTCLNCRRAQSVVDCLTDYYGIEKDRLVGKGYGDKEPKTILDEKGNRIVLTCDYINSLPTIDEQERMHQMNRRTEFQILNLDYKNRN